MFHVGWYLWKFFAQIYLERRLKDYIASLIHHFCAIGLLTLSYYSGTVRGGIVVLVLHDPADVVLASSKLFRLIHQPLLMNIGFGVLMDSERVQKCLITDNALCCPLSLGMNSEFGVGVVRDENRAVSVFPAAERVDRFL